MLLPPYPTFPNIAGKEISLREILLPDIVDIIEFAFYNAVQATSLQEAIIMLEKINVDYLNGTAIHWGIADNGTNKIIGTCGFYRGFENEKVS
jgi:[ribosomal protein S5]-alanine N-acetyltransferase